MNGFVVFGQGPTGPSGAAGGIGPAGAKGDTGPTGATGATGLVDGDKGDITVSGGGTVFTIDPGVVTLPMLADAAAPPVLIGNVSSIGPMVAVPLVTLFSLGGMTISATFPYTFGVNGWVRNKTGFYDDFSYVLPASATIEPWFGDTPWRFELQAGTCNITPFTALGTSFGHHGVARFALGTGSTIALFKTATGLWNDFARNEFIYRMSTSQTGLTFQFGIATAGANGAGAQAAAYFEFVQGADTTIHCITRDTTAQTSDTDSNITQTLGNWNVLSVIRDTSTNALTFKIDDVTVATVTSATHLIDGTDALQAFMNVTTTTNACNVDLDYTLYETKELGARAT